MTQGSTLFSRVCPDREGMQLERTLRVVCFLLDGWCSYTPCGAKGKEPARESLPVIYFDKFGLLIARIWNECFRQTGKPLLNCNEIEQSDLDNSVRFPFPFREVKGKHGRGLARWKRPQKPSYLVEIVEKLQSEGILYYFNTTLPQGVVEKQDGESVASQYPESRVAPGIPVDADTLLASPGFTKREHAVLVDLNTAMRRLEPSAIRALGTHENAAKTVEDIRKEFADLEKRRVWDKLIEKLRAEEDFSAEAQELIEYADEARRKSSEDVNGEEYRRAHAAMLSELSREDLKDAFRACQKSADSIWRNKEVMALAPTAKRVFAIARHLKALLYFRDHAGERKEQRSPNAKEWQQAWREGRTVVMALTKQPVPNDPAGCFRGSTRCLQGSVIDALIVAIEAIRGDVRY